MFLINYILLLSVQSQNLESDSDLIYVFTKKINEDEQPYQVALFFSKPSPQKIVFHSIIQHIPTVSIDYEKFSLINNNTLPQLLLFRNPRHVSLLIIEWSENDNLRKLHEFLDFFVAMLSKYARPKCLVILCANNAFDKDIEFVLYYAWLNRFLDFSIVSINRDVKLNKLTTLLHFYNPFYDLYSSLNSDVQTKIFPDKLVKGNNYGLNVPVYNAHPYLFIINDNSTKIKKIGGTYVPLMNLVVESLNFSYIITTSQDNTTIKDFFQSAFNKLANGKLYMMVNPHFNEEFAEHLLTLDCGYISEDILALVPIIPDNNICISLDVFVYIFLIPTIIWTLNVLLNACNNNKTRLRLLNVFQILFGVSVFHTHNFGKRNVVLFITVLSFVYSITFYLKFVNTLLIQGELSFDTFEELNKSQIKSYSVDNGPDRVFHNN